MYPNFTASEMHKIEGMVNYIYSLGINEHEVHESGTVPHKIGIPPSRCPITPIFKHDIRSM
jgi:hypothetical protein